MTIETLGLTQLTVDEKLQIVEELWESIAAEPQAVPLTPEQAHDLADRLEAYRENPTEGSRWEDVKRRLRDAD